VEKVAQSFPKPDLLLDELVRSPTQKDETGERDDEFFEVLDELVNLGKNVVHVGLLSRLKEIHN
jgi:hypothetical protein